MARSGGDGNDHNWFDCALCVEDGAVDFCGVNGLSIHQRCGIAIGGGAGSQFCSGKCKSAGFGGGKVVMVWLPPMQSVDQVVVGE